METSDRQFHRAVFAAALVTALYALWITFEIGGSGVTLVVSDLFRIGVPLAAAVASFRAARREQDTLRTAWTFIGLAAFSSMIGRTIWAYYELVLHQRAPFPSLADVGYLGTIPLATAGMLLLVREQTGNVSLFRRYLDGLLIAAALLFISWATVLGPFYRAHHSGVVEQWLGLAYPLGDVVIVTIVLLVSMRVRPTARDPLFLLAGGMFALALADSAYAFLTTIGAFSSNNVINVGWVIGFLLVGLAAFRVARVEVDLAGRGRTAEAFIPYIPVGLATGVAIAQQLLYGFLERFLFWNGIVVVLLLLFRQVLSHLENLQLTGTIEASYVRLRDLERFRAQLLSNVSHDLMNPLTPVQLQLAVLKKTLQRPSKTQREALEILHHNASEIQRMVGDLRDLATLEAGQLRLRLEPIDLRVLVRRTVQSFKPVARRKGVHLYADLPTALPVRVDPGRLQQVLTNLVVNAIKFTPKSGRVTVRGTQTNGGVEIRLEDTGPGLTPEEITQLFRPFTRLSESKTRENSGSGLGLYICKSLLEQHGGRIRCESPGLGFGSTFIVSLPLGDGPPGVAS